MTNSLDFRNKGLHGCKIFCRTLQPVSSFWRHHYRVLFKSLLLSILTGIFVLLLPLCLFPNFKSLFPLHQQWASLGKGLFPISSCQQQVYGLQLNMVYDIPCKNVCGTRKEFDEPQFFCGSYHCGLPCNMIGYPGAITINISQRRNKCWVFTWRKERQPGKVNWLENKTEPPKTLFASYNIF